MNDDLYENIISKIDDGTISKDDFDKFLSESMPESVRDRVRRRTIVDPTEDHVDDEGHQGMKLPSFSGRVSPKRKPSGKSQMNGRGNIGHKHSARTQAGIMAEDISKYSVLFDIMEEIRHAASKTIAILTEIEAGRVEESGSLPQILAYISSINDNNRHLNSPNMLDMLGDKSSVAYESNEKRSKKKIVENKTVADSGMVALCESSDKEYGLYVDCIGDKYIARIQCGNSVISKTNLKANNRSDAIREANDHLDDVVFQISSGN